MIDLKEKKVLFENHVHHFEEELKSLRTGRANAAIVQHIQVEAYGTLTPLEHVASISVLDAKSLVIAPWDKSVLKDIEKAIVLAQIGVNPVNDGTVIRLVMPNLTEENRKSLVKTLHQKMEHARVGIRGVRDGIKDEIHKTEKAREITEDDRYDLIEKLDALTKEHIEHIESLSSGKEKDIMTI